MKDHGLFVEKYRPTDLSTFVGNNEVKNTIQKYLDQNDIQNLLFYGSPGCGKTTLARLIVKNINCDYLYINASDENGINIIREKVKNFASSASFKPLKVIILDEADFITIEGQMATRNIIETFSRSTRFILTCNYIERIAEPIQSRCLALKIVPPSKKEIAYHLDKILEQEEIKYETNDLVYLINKFYPDLRKTLNVIQLSSKSGSLVLDKSILIESSYKLKILEELKKSKPNWRTIRQIIANSNIGEFEDLYKFLFEKASEYLPNQEGLVSIYINEHNFQSQFAIDREINCMSLIARIIELKKNKKT